MDGNFSFSKCVVIKVIYVSILTIVTSIIEVTNLATGILIIQIIMLTNVR